MDTEPNRDRPIIGVIDSGIGGLSVVLEICKRLPNHSIRYIGDSSWCPYGNKSPEQIQQRTATATEKLISMGAECIVIACNSATIHAIEYLRAHFPLPFVGMEPAIKPACKQTKNGIVGVFATEASIAGEKFHRLIYDHAGGVNVITRPCPKYVELVEAGILNGPEVEDAINEYAAPMLEAGVDTIVLGCTHYPFLLPSMKAILGNSIQLIDTGAAVAEQVARVIGKSEPQPAARDTFAFSTADAEKFRKLWHLLAPNLPAQCAAIKL